MSSSIRHPAPNDAIGFARSALPNPDIRHLWNPDARRYDEYNLRPRTFQAAKEWTLPDVRRPRLPRCLPETGKLPMTFENCNISALSDLRHSGRLRAVFRKSRLQD